MVLDLCPTASPVRVGVLGCFCRNLGEIPIISGIDRGSINSINLDKLAAAKAAAAFWIRPEGLAGGRRTAGCVAADGHTDRVTRQREAVGASILIP